MPFTISELFNSVSVQWIGLVHWSGPVLNTKPRIYTVS